MTQTLGSLAMPALREAIHGQVIAPSDPDYDAARQVKMGDVDRHPAVIVQAADVEDVRRVVVIAAESGLELAVRCGGHSNAGHGVTEGGILLDLRRMTGLDLDVAGRTAWADGGLTAIAYSSAAHAHGLATGFGDTGSVGIGGLTTGGGIGYLVRKHGLTIDSLLAAEVVTADGELHAVDGESEPDLFWAIRGGGGNFGVVSRFRYRLHQVGTVVGGMLVLPATPETLAGFMAAAEAAPEELSTIANVMPAPPSPGIPEERVGELVIMALMVHAGDVRAGERAMVPFRDLATPIIDELKPIPYPQIYPPEDESYRPLAVARTLFIDRVDLPVARDIVDRLQAYDAPMRVAQLRVLGGAMARVPADATAFAHRSSRIMVALAAFYEGPDDHAGRVAWVEGFARELRQSDEGAYVNFLADEGPERVRQAYPGATWDRLATIKRRYDPTNLFRLNQNIPPA